MRAPHPSRVPWSEPRSARFRQVGPAGVVGGWTTVAQINGHWSHCDASFQGPVAYAGRPWRLLGRTGGIWTQLAADLIDHPALFRPNAALLTGVIAAIRGWPCDGFELQVANGAAIAPADWQLYGWGREAAIGAAGASGAPGAAAVVQPAAANRADSGEDNAGAAVQFYVVHAGPCQFASYSVRNVAAAARYVMLFDSAGPLIPVNGSVPILLPHLLGVNETGTWDLDEFMVGNGILIASSTTDGTLTAGGANDVRITGFWR